MLESPWFGVHVSSLLFAYASFALACVLGITYVLQFKEIKAKDLGFFYERLPSLNVLDEMNLRAVKIGWLFLTVGLITGGIWASQLQPSGDSARRRCRWAIRRSSSPCCAGRSTRSSSTRSARSAGAGAARRGSRPSASASCC